MVESWAPINKEKNKTNNVDFNAKEKLVSKYNQTPINKAEVIVAIGGDGEMLKALRESISINLPVFGLNKGSIGFLMNRINNRNLIIPHPRLHIRKFVIKPICDINPLWKHPILKKKAINLLKGLANQKIFNINSEYGKSND